MKQALLVVDVQRDFCEGGALAVLDTRSLLDPLCKCIDRARNAHRVIIFTKDWHPPDHLSFGVNGGPWPVHCLAESQGAELILPLSAKAGDVVIRKGTKANAPGYSAFESTDLSRILRSADVTSVAVCGIATEYCVRATALDAAKALFQTVVLVDLTRAVQARAGDDVLSELEQAGIRLIHSAAWLSE